MLSLSVSNGESVMHENAQNFSKAGFARRFAVPALWLFVIPVIGLWFFGHAQV
jgi:hypothetical protein